MTFKFRRDKDLRRRRPVKRPRETVLIVCEGEKTEPLYFKYLRKRLHLGTVDVTVEGDKCGSSPISVVDHAIRLKADRSRSKSPIEPPYKVVWCVIDVEAPHPHSSLARALNKAQGNGLRVALTNPCFEYWYILHFRKTDRMFEYNDHVIRELRTHMAEYNKGDNQTPVAVFPHTTVAMERAEEYRRNKGFGEDISNLNSSTNVDLVVGHLFKIAELPIEKDPHENPRA